MSPLLRLSTPFRTAVVVGLMLTPLLAARSGLAAPMALPDDGSPGIATARDPGERLAQARAASEAADAALDAAKRIATPGHLLDPLPGLLGVGLGDLQSQYAEMERKAAGYRATLGDQHPTLKGAEEVMAELRAQILEGVRRAVATARQDAARAHATIAALQTRSRAADTTGSIAPPPPSPGLASPSLPTTPGDARPDVPPARRMSDEGPLAPPMAPRSASDSFGGSSLRTLAALIPLALRHPWAAAAAGLLVGATALGILAALFRPRRRRTSAPAAVRIEPAALIEPGPTPSRAAAPRDIAPVPEPVPVLAALPLRADDDPATVQARLDHGADAALARAAASVFATLAAAAGPDARRRVGVSVTPATGAPDSDADAAALALASAAAEAGRRVLLVDDHPDGRLRRTLAAGATTVAAVEVGGRIRTVLRVVVAGRVLAVLAEDAGPPAIGPAPARLANLDGFDAIVSVGQPAGAETVPAGLALLVARPGADASALAAAARVAAGGAGRPCGVVLVETPADETVAVPRQPEPVPPRRRVGPEAATARLGLRRSFDPVRRRA